MKVKNALTDYQENCIMQDYDPMEELHMEAHYAMVEASKHLNKDQIWVLCYLSGLNSSDYTKGEAQ